MELIQLSYISLLKWTNICSWSINSSHTMTISSNIFNAQVYKLLESQFAASLCQHAFLNVHMEQAINDHRPVKSSLDFKPIAMSNHRVIYKLLVHIMNKIIYYIQIWIKSDFFYSNWGASPNGSKVKKKMNHLLMRFYLFYDLLHIPKSPTYFHF